MSKSCKSISFLILFLAILFIPITIVVAQSWAVPFEQIGATIVNSALKVPYYASDGLLRFANWFVSWVTSPKFIKVSYTHNPIVTDGWTTVRDFVNMGFIIILAFIGIAVALRVKEYEIGKILPRFILVAILINFTPLLCGLIIDASNIIMNYFLALGGGGGLNISVVHQSENLFRTIAISSFEKGTFPLVFLTIFNFTASFILFLFGLLFLMRHIVLWLFIILSPLALFAYILPASSWIWKKWLNEFINWCFVGITGAFFLWLGKLTFEKATILITAPTGSNLGAISEILYMLVPFTFLLAGFFATTSTSAIGARQTIGFFKSKTAKKLGQGTGRLALTGIRKATPKGVKKAMTRLETLKKWGQGEAGVRGWAKRAVSTPFVSTTRTLGKAANKLTGGMALEREEAEKAYKEALKRDEMENLAAFRSAKGASRVGIARAMGEKKQLASLLAKKQLKNEELLAPYEHAVAINDMKARKEIEFAASKDLDLMTKFGEILDKANKNLPKEMQTRAGLTDKDRFEKGFQSLQDKIYASVRKREDMEKLGGVTSEMVNIFARDPHQISLAAQTFGRAFTDKLQKYADEKGAEGLYAINPQTGKVEGAALARYLTSTAAQTYGLHPVSGIETPQAAREWERAAAKVENEAKKANWHNKAELDQLALVLSTKRAHAENEQEKILMKSAVNAIHQRIQDIKKGEKLAAEKAAKNKPRRPEAGEYQEGPRPEAGEE